jgi:uncharacterized protein (UPF0218 family)
MKDWLNKDSDLLEAYRVSKIMEQYIKQVKSAIKERLEEDAESVPGLKLRKSGNTVSYDCPEVAEILMSTNVVQWNDFLKACRFVEGSMVNVWADKRGITKSDARKELKKRLGDIAVTKPKNPAIIETND